MKIDISKDDVALHALASALEGKFDAIHAAQEERGSFDFQFIVNGVELNFSAVMNEMNLAYAAAVETRAKELVEERVKDSMNGIYEELAECNRRLSFLLHKTFPLGDYEEY